MKRFSTISFALLYLFLITGLTVNIHYCLGEIESISLFSESDPCCCEETELPNSCCNDEQIVLQFNADEQLIESISLDFKTPIIGNLASQSTTILRLIQPCNTIQDYEPPPPSNLPLWLKNATLTYYG